MRREDQCQECRALEDQEAKLVHGVVESVRRQVPDLDPATAELYVIAALDVFRDARVRDYLPILLERAVLTKLAS